MQQRVVREWVVTPAIRDPIRVPPDVPKAAHIVRALLLEGRLTAKDDYHIG